MKSADHNFLHILDRKILRFDCNLLNCALREQSTKKIALVQVMVLVVHVMACRHYLSQ